MSSNTQPYLPLPILSSLNPAHSYDIQTDRGTIEVHANNRDQAARLAEKAGYKVYSVNMTG